MQFIKQNYVESDKLAFAGNQPGKRVFYPFGVATSCARQYLVPVVAMGSTWWCVMPYIARFRNAEFLAELAKKLFFAPTPEAAYNIVGNFKYESFEIRKKALKAKKELQQRLQNENEARINVANFERDYFPLIYCARLTFSPEGYKKFIEKVALYAGSIGLEHTPQTLWEGAVVSKVRFAKEIKKVQKNLNEAHERASINKKFNKWQRDLHRQFFTQVKKAHKGKIDEFKNGFLKSMFSPNDYKSFTKTLEKFGVKATETLWQHYVKEDRDLAKFLSKRRDAIDKSIAQRNAAKAKYLEERILRLKKRVKRLAKNEQEKLKRLQRKLSNQYRRPTPTLPTIANVASFKVVDKVKAQSPKTIEKPNAVELQQKFREKVKALALWRKPAIRQIVAEANKKPQIVFVNINEPRMETHKHTCYACKCVYEHTHMMRRAAHRQFEHQCPNEKCPQYHGTENKTKAVLIELNKSFQEKIRVQELKEQLGLVKRECTTILQRTEAQKQIHEHKCYVCKRRYVHNARCLQRDGYRYNCPYAGCARYHNGVNPTKSIPKTNIDVKIEEQFEAVWKPEKTKDHNGTKSKPPKLLTENKSPPPLPKRDDNTTVVVVKRQERPTLKETNMLLALKPLPQREKIVRLNTPKEVTACELPLGFSVKENNQGKQFVSSKDFVCMHSVDDSFDIGNKVLNNDIISSYDLGKLTSVISIGLPISDCNPAHVYVVGEVKIQYRNRFRGVTYTGAYCSFESEINYISGTPIFNTDGQICSLITSRQGRLYTLVCAKKKISKSSNCWARQAIVPALTMLLASQCIAGPVNNKIKATEMPVQVVALDISRDAERVKAQVHMVHDYKKTKSADVAKDYYTKYQQDLSTKTTKQLEDLEREIDSMNIDIKKINEYISGLQNNSKSLGKKADSIVVNDITEKTEWTLKLIKLIETDSGDFIENYAQLEALIQYLLAVENVLMDNNIEGAAALQTRLAELSETKKMLADKKNQIVSLQGDMESYKTKLVNLISKVKLIRIHLNSAIKTLQSSIQVLKKMEEQLTVATRLLQAVQSKIDMQSDEPDYAEMKAEEIEFDIDVYNKQLQQTLRAQSALQKIVETLSENVNANITIPEEFVKLPEYIRCSKDFRLVKRNDFSSYVHDKEEIVFSNRILSISVENASNIRCLVANVSAYAGLTNIIQDGACGVNSFEHGIQYLRDPCVNITTLKKGLVERFKLIDWNINVYTAVKYCAIFATSVVITERFGAIFSMAFIIVLTANGVLADCTIDGKVIQLTPSSQASSVNEYKISANMYKHGCIHAANMTISFDSINIVQVYNKIGYIASEMSLKYEANYSCPSVRPIWETFESSCNQQVGTINVFRKTESYNTMWSGTSCGMNGQVRMGHCFMLKPKEKIAVYQISNKAYEISIDVLVNYFNMKTRHQLTQEINTLNYKISGVVYNVVGTRGPQYIFKYKDQFLQSQQALTLVDACWCKNEACTRLRDTSCLQLSVQQNGVRVENEIRLNPFASWINTSMVVNNEEVSFDENSTSATISQEKAFVDLYMETKPLSMIVTWCQDIDFTIKDTKQGEESNFKYAQIQLENMHETDCLVNVKCRLCQLVGGLVYQVSNHEISLKILCGSLLPTYCTISTPAKQQDIVVKNLIKNYKLELSYVYDHITAVLERTGVKIDIDAYKNSITGLFGGVFRLLSGLTSYISLACGTVISINLYSQGYTRAAVVVLVFSFLPLVRGEQIESNGETMCFVTMFMPDEVICEIVAELLTRTFQVCGTVSFVAFMVALFDGVHRINDDVIESMIQIRRLAGRTINVINRMRLTEQEAYEKMYPVVQFLIALACCQNICTLLAFASYKLLPTIVSAIHCLFHDTEIIEWENKCSITMNLSLMWPKPVDESLHEHVKQGFINPIGALKYHSRYIIDLKETFNQFCHEDFVNKSLTWKNRVVCNISCVNGNLVSAAHCFYNVEGAAVFNDLIVYGPNQDSCLECLIQKPCCSGNINFKFAPGDSGLCIALNNTFYVHSGVRGMMHCCAIHEEAEVYHSDDKKKLVLKRSNIVGKPVMFIEKKSQDGKVESIIAHHGVASGKINAKVEHKAIPVEKQRTQKEVMLKKEVKQQLFSKFVRDIFASHKIETKIVFLNKRTTTYRIFIDSIPEMIKDRVIAECYEQALKIASRHQLTLPQNKAHAVIAVSDFELEYAQADIKCRINRIDGNKKTVPAITADKRGDLTVKCSSTKNVTDFDRLRQRMAKLALAHQAQRREALPVAVESSTTNQEASTMSASTGAVKKQPKVTSKQTTIKYQSGNADDEESTSSPEMPQSGSDEESWIEYLTEHVGISAVSAQIFCRINWVICQGGLPCDQAIVIGNEPKNYHIFSDHSMNEILVALEEFGIIPRNMEWAQAVQHMRRAYQIDANLLPEVKIISEDVNKPLATLESQIVKKDVIALIDELRSAPATTPWMILNAPTKSSRSVTYDHAETNWYGAGDTTFITRLKGPTCGFGFISKGYHYSAHHVMRKGKLQLNFTSDLNCSTIIEPMERYDYSKDYSPVFVSTPDKGDFHVVDLTEDHRSDFSLSRIEPRGMYFAFNFERKEYVTMISQSPTTIDPDFKGGIPLRWLQLFDVANNRTIPQIKQLKGWSGSPIFTPEGIPVGIVAQSIPKQREDGDRISTLVAAEIKPPTLQSNADLMTGYFAQIYAAMAKGKIPMITAPTGFGKTTSFVFHFADWLGKRKKRSVSVAVGIPKRYAIAELDNYICDFRAKVNMDTFATVTMRLRVSEGDLNVKTYKCTGAKERLVINYMTCGSLLRRDLADFDLIIVDEIHTRNDADILALEWYVQNYAINRTVALTATTWSSQNYEVVRIGVDAGDRITERKLELWKDHDKKNCCQLVYSDKAYAMPLESHKDRTIIFCATIKECEQMRDHIVEQGHPCAVVTSRNRDELSANTFIAATNCIETGITIPRTTNVVDFMQKFEKVCELVAANDAIVYETRFRRSNISAQESAQRKGRTGRDVEGTYWVPDGCNNDGLFVEHPEAAMCQGALSILQNDKVYDDYGYENMQNDAFIEKMCILHPRFLATRIKVKNENIYGSSQATRENFLKNKLRKSYLETIDPITFYLANFLPAKQLEELRRELSDAGEFIEEASEDDYMLKNRGTNVVIPEFKELETYTDDVTITAAVTGGMLMGLSAVIYNVCNAEAGARRVVQYCVVPRAQFMSRIKSYRYLKSEDFAKRNKWYDQVKQHFATFKRWLAKIIMWLEEKIPESNALCRKLKNLLRKLSGRTETNTDIPVVSVPEAQAPEADPTEEEGACALSNNEHNEAEQEFSEENLIAWIVDLIDQLQQGGDHAIKITTLLAAMGVSGICIEEISRYFGDILPTAMIATAGVFLSQNMPTYLYGSSAAIIMLLNFAKNLYLRSDPELTKGGALVAGAVIAPIALSVGKGLFAASETQKAIINRLSEVKPQNINVTPNITVNQITEMEKIGLYSNWAAKAVYGSGTYDTGYSLARALINIMESDGDFKSNWLSVTTACLCTIKTVKGFTPQCLVAATVTASAHMIYRTCIHAVRYTRLGMGGEIRNENIASGVSAVGSDEVNSKIKRIQRIYQAAVLAVGCALNPSAIVSTALKIVAEVVREEEPSLSVDRFLQLGGETVCQSPIIVLLASAYSLYGTATQHAESWLYNRLHAEEQYSSAWESLKGAVIDCYNAIKSAGENIACAAVVSVVTMYRRIITFLKSIVERVNGFADDVRDRVADMVLSSVFPTFIADYLIKKGKNHTKDVIVAQRETNSLKEARSVFVRYGLINVVSYIDQAIKSDPFAVVLHGSKMSLEEHRLFNSMSTTELINNPNEWASLASYNRALGANCYTLDRAEACMEIRRYMHYVESLSQEVEVKTYNVKTDKDIMQFMAYGDHYQLFWIKPKTGQWQIIEISPTTSRLKYHLYLPRVRERIGYGIAQNSHHTKEVADTMKQVTRGNKVDTRISPNVASGEILKLLPYIMLPQELQKSHELLRPTFFRRTRIDYYSEFLRNETEDIRWVRSHFHVEGKYMATGLVQSNNMRKVNICLPSQSVSPPDEAIFTRSSKAKILACAERTYSTAMLFRLYNATEILQEKATIVHLVTGHSVIYQVGLNAYKTIDRFGTCNCQTLLKVEGSEITFKQSMTCRASRFYTLRFSGDVTFANIKYKKQMRHVLSTPVASESTACYVLSKVLPSLQLRVKGEPIKALTGIVIAAKKQNNIEHIDMGMLDDDVSIHTVTAKKITGDLVDALRSNQVELSDWIAYSDTEYFYVRTAAAVALWCTGHTFIGNYTIVPATESTSKAYRCLENIRKKVAALCSNTIENVVIREDEIQVDVSSTNGLVTSDPGFDLSRVFEESCFLNLARHQVTVKPVKMEQRCGAHRGISLIKPEYQRLIYMFTGAKDVSELNRENRRALRVLLREGFKDMSWAQILELLDSDAPEPQRQHSKGIIDSIKGVMFKTRPTTASQRLLDQANVVKCDSKNPIDLVHQNLEQQVGIKAERDQILQAVKATIWKLSELSEEDIGILVEHIEEIPDDLIFRILSYVLDIEIQLLITQTYNENQTATVMRAGVLSEEKPKFGRKALRFLLGSGWWLIKRDDISRAKAVANITQQSVVVMDSSMVKLMTARLNKLPEKINISLSTSLKDFTRGHKSRVPRLYEIFSVKHCIEELRDVEIRLDGGVISLYMSLRHDAFLLDIPTEVEKLTNREVATVLYMTKVTAFAQSMCGENRPEVAMTLAALTDIYTNMATKGVVGKEDEVRLYNNFLILDPKASANAREDRRAYLCSLRSGIPELPMVMRATRIPTPRRAGRPSTSRERLEKTPIVSGKEQPHTGGAENIELSELAPKKQPLAQKGKGAIPKDKKTTTKSSEKNVQSENYCLEGFFDRLIRTKPYHGWVTKAKILERVEASANELVLQQAEKLAIAPYQERLNIQQERDLLPAEMYSIVHFDRCSKRALCPIYQERLYNLDEKILGVKESIDEFKSRRAVPIGIPIKPFTKVDKIPYAVTVSDQGLQALNDSIGHIKGEAWQILKRYNREYLPKTYEYDAISRGYYKAQALDRDLGLFKTAQNIADLTSGAGGFVQWAIISHNQKLKRRIVYNSLVLPGHAVPREELLQQSVRKVKNVEIYKVKTETNGDIRYREVLETFKQFGENINFDVIITDCGESHPNLERESQWQLEEHTIAGVTRQNVHEKTHAKSFSDALINYLCTLRSGGTMVVKMMGFSNHTITAAMKYSKYFNGVILYKMPTASYQSREWYLCLYGFDKQKYSRERFWDVSSSTWVSQQQSTVAIILPPLHGKKNLAKSNTNILHVPYGADPVKLMLESPDKRIIVTSDERAIEASGIQIMARMVLPESQLRVNAEKRRWITSVVQLDQALKIRSRMLEVWERDLQKITVCQNEQAMKRAIENVVRTLKTGTHVDCVDISNLIQHAKYLYVQKLQEFTRWAKIAYKKLKTTKALQTEPEKEAIIMAPCSGKTTLARAYEGIDDLELYDRAEATRLKRLAMKTGNWAKYDKEVADMFIIKQFLAKGNQSGVILLDRPQIAQAAGVKISFIMLPTDSLFELNIKRKLMYDKLGEQYARQSYAQLSKMANKYPIVRFNRYEEAIDLIKKHSKIKRKVQDEDPYEIPMYYRKWMTPEGHWRFPKHLELDAGYYQVQRTTDEWKIAKQFEFNGVTYTSHMAERIRQVMNIAKQNGYKQYPASGIFENVTEYCRLSFPQKFGHEKHNCNKIINSCMYNVFGLDYMNSTFGHTQCTPDHLHAAWKKRLDIMPQEPSATDAAVLWQSALHHVTPEYKKLASGPNSQKFKPWTYEEAIKHINNQGKGGHFDHYLNNAEAVADPAFKERVLQAIKRLNQGLPTDSYQTVRDKRETKAKKNITDEGRIDCPDEWNPNGKEYQNLNSTEKKIRREARVQWLKENSNLAPRNIRFADQVQRIVDLMILGPMQDHHVNKEKLYMGTSTGTPLWDLGTLTKGIHDFYAHHTEQEYMHCRSDPFVRNIIYSDSHKRNLAVAKNRKLIKTLIASGDFSGWDGTVSLTDLAILHQSYARLYRDECQLLLKTRFEMWMWSIVITDHGNVLLCQAQRSSGDQDTSHGNTKLNDIYHVAATAEALGITVAEASKAVGEVKYRTITSDKWRTYYVRRVSHVADGDDNIHFGDEKDIRLLDRNGSLFLERCGKKIRCGTRPGYSLTDKFENMTFCSHQYIRVRLGTLEGKPIGDHTMTDRPPIFRLVPDFKKIPEKWGQIYKLIQEEVSKELKNLNWQDGDVWGLTHQHAVEEKVGLRIKYLPIRPLPNILGKLNYTLKQATNVIDLRRDYGTDRRSDRFAVKNEYAIEITRGKLLAYLLNYIHLESVRTIITTILSVIGEGTCNWDELNKRFNVPKIFENIHTAIHSVFGVKNLTEVEVISHHWDREQLRNIAYNTRMTHEELKVNEKSVCPQNVRDLRMMLDDWANEFAFNEGIRRDNSIFEQGNITRVHPAIRMLSFAAIISSIRPSKPEITPSEPRRYIYFSNTSLTSIKGHDSILREAKKEAKKNFSKICTYAKGAKTIVIAKFKKGDDVAQLIEDTANILKHQDRCSPNIEHTEVNVAAGLLDKTRVIRTLRSHYKKFAVK